MINLIAMDVYDGTPTIVTVWLTIVVKLTILIFLQGLIELTLPDSVSLVNNYVISLFTSLKGEENNIASTIANYPLDFTPNTGSIAVEGFITLTNYIYHIMGSYLPSPMVYGTEECNVQIKYLLLISSLLSLLVGTIAGLSQNKVKRLLAFSSISHVGFLLLALGIYTQKSIDSFIFYLVQYSITSLNIFLILLAFGYLLYYSKVYFAPQPFGRDSDNSNPTSELLKLEKIEEKPHFTYLAPHTASSEAGVGRDISLKDINYLIELKGQLYKNPVLSISLAICLFSMAGIPPLIGFFSKQFVLFSSIENGNNFLSIIAILVSVISASYYLKLIKITFFSVPTQVQDNEAYPGPLPYGIGELENYYLKGALSAKQPLGCGAKNRETINSNGYLSNIHSYIIAILTFLILFFFLDPSILLNGTQLISLTIFNL